MSLLRGSPENIAEQAERLLQSILPEGFSTLQEWDNCIECRVKLPSGKIVGEMISLDTISETKIQETAERLRRLRLGEDVVLVNPIPTPIRIVRTND